MCSRMKQLFVQRGKPTVKQTPWMWLSSSDKLKFRSHTKRLKLVIQIYLWTFVKTCVMGTWLLNLKLKLRRKEIFHLDARQTYSQLPEKIDNSNLATPYSTWAKVLCLLKKGKSGFFVTIRNLMTIISTTPTPHLGFPETCLN